MGFKGETKRVLRVERGDKVRILREPGRVWIIFQKVTNFDIKKSDRANVFFFDF